MRMLKFPVTPARLWATWKFVAVDVMVRTFPAQVPVPAWNPKTLITPAAVASDLHKLAVMVGRVLPVFGATVLGPPDMQMRYAPKLGRLGISLAVEVIGAVKNMLSLLLAVKAISA